MKVSQIKKIKQSHQQDFMPATDDFIDVAYRIAPGYNQKFILDLKEINKELGRTRKKGQYAKSHLSNIRDQILDCPTVKVCRKFGAYVFEIAFLHFDEVQKKEKSDQKVNAPEVVVESQKQYAENDTEILSEETGIDQQQLIYADQKCRSVGVVFQKKDLWNIAKYPRELIDIAIEYFRHADSRNHIPSPTGWLICCLRDKWYKTFRPEKYVQSAEQKLFELQDWFIQNFGSLPTRGYIPKN